MSLHQRIAFIGAGSMTEALVTGLLKAGLATTGELHATDLQAHRREHMHRQYGIRVGADNREAAGWAQVVVLSVEPEHMDAVLEGIAPALGAEAVLISIAAGYPLARLAARVKRGPRLVRAMPNTPSSVLAGVAALAFDAQITPQDRATATTMFEAVGKVVVVDEAMMDAVTGLSGSGPAYIYVMIEALTDGAVRMGLPRPVAESLAAQTVLGAARIVLETGEHPARLKDRVTSPGGTTLAGLASLEEGRLRATLISAVEAATRRARELGSSA